MDMSVSRDHFQAWIDDEIKTGKSMKMFKELEDGTPSAENGV
jgi:hypothetical protein